MAQEQNLYRVLADSQYDMISNNDKTGLDGKDESFIKEALFIINKTNNTTYTEWLGKYKIPSMRDFKRLMAYAARKNVTGEHHGWQDQLVYGVPAKPSLSVAVPNAVFDIAYSKLNYMYDYSRSDTLGFP
jgi:hypothetical protein